MGKQWLLLRNGGIASDLFGRRKAVGRITLGFDWGLFRVTLADPFFPDPEDSERTGPLVRNGGRPGEPDRPVPAGRERRVPAGPAMT